MPSQDGIPHGGQTRAGYTLGAMSEQPDIQTPGSESEGPTIALRATSESDRTYIARLNFLTEVFGNEDAPVCAHFNEDYRYYVEDWEPNNGGFIAYDDIGIPAGGVWLLWGKDGNYGYGHVEDGIPELAIAVEGRFRGQGVGSLLINAAIELARELGTPGISLCVDVENPRAHKLYLSLGFEEVRAPGEDNHHVLLKRFA